MAFFNTLLVLLRHKLRLAGLAHRPGAAWTSFEPYREGDREPSAQGWD